MRVLMKRTTAGSPNGTVSKLYKKGEIYDMPEGLANVFFDLGVAEKEINAAPENKEIRYVSEKKKVSRRRS